MPGLRCFSLTGGISSVAFVESEEPPILAADVELFQSPSEARRGSAEGTLGSRSVEAASYAGSVHVV